jgi:hypothetical protein
MYSMTNTTTERQPRWPQRSLLVVAVIVMLTGGCALVMNKPHPLGSSTPWDEPAHPLTDAQAMAQVVESAKQIVAGANLQGVSGGFSFASCNDQGDPPYQGRAVVDFLIQGDPTAYFQQVRSAMISQGWNDGPPPGQHFHGTALNKNGVTASISFLPSDHSYGQITLYGECRNPTDHRHDGKTNSTDITDQLRPA